MQAWSAPNDGDIRVQDSEDGSLVATLTGHGARTPFGSSSPEHRWGIERIVFRPGVRELASVVPATS